MTLYKPFQCKMRLLVIMDRVTRFPLETLTALEGSWVLNWTKMCKHLDKGVRRNKQIYSRMRSYKEGMLMKDRI